MRRGHVAEDAGGLAPRADTRLAPRLPPGTCPRCRKHIGRGVRGHALTCGEPAAAPPVIEPRAAPAMPSAKLLAPAPLIGPQPEEAAPAPEVRQSPRLPRLVHGVGENGRPVPGRHRKAQSLAERQAAAVAALKREAGA